MKTLENTPMKIYTLNVPPSSDEPYLHPSRHRRILQRFKRGDNACHTLNSEGEVDFYLLLPPEDEADEYPEKTEEFALTILKDDKLKLELYYDEELFADFLFDLQNQLDSYCLRFMASHKRVNIYFIHDLEEQFICYGYKSLNLPSVLCYDLSRHLAGKKPLILPHFSQDFYSDEFFTPNMLLANAWGFYLDYTRLIERLENNEDAEEILSLHILHGLARLQKSRRKSISEDRLILWVGRRISLDYQELPKEYYSIYLSGPGLKGIKTRDAAAIIFEEALKEVPEYWGCEWVSPLAEEAVPLVVLAEHILYRLDLADRFYGLSRQLFSEHHSPQSQYQSYYDKIYVLQSEQTDSKIYNLWLKRWEQGYDETRQLPVGEIEKIIEGGREEDLTRIFMLLANVPEPELDNLIVKLCERYHDKAEPYLLAGLQSSLPHLKTAALLGLGILESKAAIPSLMRLVRQGTETQNVWDTFLMIGDPAVPALADLLREPLPHVRAKARETLALLGTPAAVALLQSFSKEELHE